MADIGKFNELPVIAHTANGAYLDGGELGEILLPNRYVPENCELDDLVDVFLYTDSLDRLVATTDKPYVEVGGFASLNVKQVNKLGAFLDWGLPKDLLVPHNLQHSKMEVGKRYLVHVFLDQRTERLVASSKLDKYLDIWPAEYEAGQAVNLTIGGKTDLGFKAIINNQHWGLIFFSEVHQKIFTGQQITGYIKNVREDGRIDLSLSRAGKGKVIDFTDKLLAYLKDNEGFCPLHDKSSPQEISKTFGVSKKAFKATVGHLLKQKKISIEPNGIKLK
ncbi:GntR family transcriptional regulator [Thalassotalea sp. M1531]|uniref:GntR family transcriptional regulator n=1 Tax=Thalassotalea algicola TaxID=2716224 RepID=A0A7Y0Q6C8_9GAMM|nr:S1-like domain-containing RNA-binding protein [Thalassotalea algicola]NMP31879.1 GntR family transcriptional regulator [Thalassotalea algicola]